MTVKRKRKPIFTEKDLQAMIPGTIHRAGDKQTSFTKKGYKPVPGEVWLPSTGGIRPQIFRKNHMGVVSLKSQPRAPRKKVNPRPAIKRAEKRSKAEKFADELVMIRTSKTTSLISLKSQLKINLTAARKLYREAKERAKVRS